MATLINLLPDIRLAKLAFKRRKRLATIIASTVSGVGVVVVVVLFFITQGQQIKINALSGEIKQSQSQVSSTPDLAKILTVQQHLNSLNGLYAQKIYLSNLYSVLSSLTPGDVAMLSLELDPQNNLKMAAQARSYGAAAKFVKAVEASNVSLGFGAGANKMPYFGNIKLTTVAADATNANKVNFTFTATMSSEVTRG